MIKYAGTRDATIYKWQGGSDRANINSKQLSTYTLFALSLSEYSALHNKIKHKYTYIREAWQVWQTDKQHNLSIHPYAE